MSEVCDKNDLKRINSLQYLGKIKQVYDKNRIVSVERISKNEKYGYLKNLFINYPLSKLHLILAIILIIVVIFSLVSFAVFGFEIFKIIKQKMDFAVVIIFVITVIIFTLNIFLPTIWNTITFLWKNKNHSKMSITGKVKEVRIEESKDDFEILIILYNDSKIWVDSAFLITDFLLIDDEIKVEYFESGHILNYFIDGNKIDSQIMKARQQAVEEEEEEEEEENESKFSLKLYSALLAAVTPLLIFIFLIVHIPIPFKTITTSLDERLCFSLNFALYLANASFFILIYLSLKKSNLIVILSSVPFLITQTFILAFWNRFSEFLSYSTLLQRALGSIFMIFSFVVWEKAYELKKTDNTTWRPFWMMFTAIYFLIFALFSQFFDI